MNRQSTDLPVPEPVARIAAHMAGFPAPWCLCGGWAVDAWLERVTREHGDVDISVFVRDQQALFEHLAGWQLLAHGPAWAPSEAEEWWDGQSTLPTGTHIHARPPEYAGPVPEGGIARSEDGFWVEFYLDDRSGDDWVLSPDPRITLPLRTAVGQSAWGIPLAAPEVVLLFKSRDLRPNDMLDFQALVPHLAPSRRDWLRDAISRLGHPWLNSLTSEGGPR